MPCMQTRRWQLQVWKGIYSMHAIRSHGAGETPPAHVQQRACLVRMRQPGHGALLR